MKCVLLSITSLDGVVLFCGVNVLRERIRTKGELSEQNVSLSAQKVGTTTQKRVYPHKNRPRQNKKREPIVLAGIISNFHKHIY